MLLSLIILLCFLLAFLWGSKRGFLLTVVSALGYGLILVCAYLFNAPLTNLYTHLFGSQSGAATFYHALAVWTVLFVGGVLMRISLTSVTLVAKLPVLKQVDHLLGGLIALVAMDSLVFFALVLLKNWPDKTLAAGVVNAPVAQLVLTKTPLIFRQVVFHF